MTISRLGPLPLSPPIRLKTKKKAKEKAQEKAKAKAKAKEKAKAKAKARQNIQRRSNICQDRIGEEQEQERESEDIFLQNTLR